MFQHIVVVNFNRQQNLIEILNTNKQNHILHHLKYDIQLQQQMILQLFLIYLRINIKLETHSKQKSIEVITQSMSLQILLLK